MVSNVQTMMYTGEVPWHGLGKKLDNPSTAEEAIIAAGLDWKVELEPMFLKDGTEVNGHRAVQRTDSKDIIGVVGDLYHPIQPRESFSFADVVVGRGQAIYHTAGALGKGERIWLLAKLPGEMRIKQTDDVTEKYLLMCNSYDGSLALRMFFTPVRVVCQNTLNVALSRAHKDGISIRHTPGLEMKVQEAQRALGLAVRYYDDLNSLSNALAGVKVMPKQVKEYLQKLIPDNAAAESHTRTENIRDQITSLFEDAETNNLPGIQGTWWSAYNALGEYVDHKRSTRGSDDQEKANNRLNSIWFGSGAELKRKGWDLALQEAGLVTAA